MFERFYVPNCHRTRLFVYCNTVRGLYQNRGDDLPRSRAFHQPQSMFAAELPDNKGCYREVEASSRCIIVQV